MRMQQRRLLRRLRSCRVWWQMSHYSCAVIIPYGGRTLSTTAVEAHVMDLMGPFMEPDGEWGADGSRWDWFVIGGRWDGAIKGFDWEPIKQTCTLCDGTGTRPDGLERFGAERMAEMKGCNGCEGTGQSDAWPTDEGYRRPERNFAAMPEVSQKYTPHSFVTPDGEWHENGRMAMFAVVIPDEDGKEPGGDEYADEWKDARNTYSRHLVVGLDCHV